MSDKKTFFLDVENVGRFSFYHRTLHDEMRIGVEYSRLTEGIERPTRWLDVFANMVSVLTVLLHESPTNWVLEELDPLDKDSYRQIVAVYTALRSQEARFRGGDGAGREDARAGDGGLDQSVVSPPFQSAAE